MTQVRELTMSQKDLLTGQKWNDNTFFNPTLDADGKWFVSNEEAEGCDVDGLSWVKSLPLIVFNPITEEEI